MPKTHLPHPTKANVALCGAHACVTRDGKRRPAPVFILKHEVVDAATCGRCQQLDDIYMVRSYQLECFQAGIDPETGEKIR